MSKRKKSKKRAGTAAAGLIGVRMRKWGRWVSEIRVPKSRTRIWLGSFDTADEAARAYDAAVYCLRGSKARFNFPDGNRPQIDDDQRRSLTEDQIREIAVKLAFSSSSNGSDEAGPTAAVAAEVTARNAETTVDTSCAVDGTEFDFENFLFGDESFMEMGEDEMRELWDLL